LRTITVEGTLIDNYDQVVASPIFKEIIKEYVGFLESIDSPILDVLLQFKHNNGYDYQEMVFFLYLLTLRPISERNSNADVHKLHDFIEGLYDFWREKHRFIIKRERYPRSFNVRDSVIKSTEFIGNTFEKTVRNLYRTLEKNIFLKTEKILREVPSGAQVIFLVDKPRIREKERLDYHLLYSMPFIWGIIFEPPVIFHTKSNKRKGVFPVVNEKILSKIDLGQSKWYVLPIHVGRLILYIYINSEYLCHVAGLANLFEIATPEELRKPDGIVFFGLPLESIGKDYINGVVFKDDLYVGVVPDIEENDYFGYAKKIVLTVHNLIMIDTFKLPIHGSLARIKLKSGQSATAMFVGDSGAGKSETLDALGRLTEISDLEIIIDDMGSLDIENDRVVAYGTETGAFVRLDDLPPGYAYATIDRSIFMNPDQSNARVIVPYGNFDRITAPTPIDFFLYANNFTNVNSNEERIRFFRDPDIALETFSKGARMAKGTTSEEGLSYSYFANPFGAVQRREAHEKIARKYITKMFNEGIRVGEIRTMLGIKGYEREGPYLAAKDLLRVITHNKSSKGRK